MTSLISNDEIISPSNSTSLFWFQFCLKNPCIAGLWKYFLGENGNKRDRPNGGVIVLPLLRVYLKFQSPNNQRNIIFVERMIE